MCSGRTSGGGGWCLTPALCPSLLLLLLVVAGPPAAVEAQGLLSGGLLQFLSPDLVFSVVGCELEELVADCDESLLQELIGDAQGLVAPVMQSLGLGENVSGYDPLTGVEIPRLQLPLSLGNAGGSDISVLGLNSLEVASVSRSGNTLDMSFQLEYIDVRGDFDVSSLFKINQAVGLRVDRPKVDVRVVFGEGDAFSIDDIQLDVGYNKYKLTPLDGGLAARLALSAANSRLTQRAVKLVVPRVVGEIEKRMNEEVQKLLEGLSGEGNDS